LDEVLHDAGVLLSEVGVPVAARVLDHVAAVVQQLRGHKRDKRYQDHSIGQALSDALVGSGGCDPIGPEALWSEVGVVGTWVKA
jgi:hypothetical protein